MAKWFPKWLFKEIVKSFLKIAFCYSRLYGTSPKSVSLPQNLSSPHCLIPNPHLLPAAYILLESTITMISCTEMKLVTVHLCLPPVSHKKFVGLDSHGGRTGTYCTSRLKIPFSKWTFKAKGYPWKLESAGETSYQWDDFSCFQF